MTTAQPDRKPARAAPLSRGLRMGIDVMVRGWDQPGWCPSFYPEDLPPDWRLTYFANAFESVLVPMALWQAAQPAGLALWAADVPERFRFYLEFDCADDLQTIGRGYPDLARAAAALGGRYSGKVAVLPPVIPSTDAGGGSDPAAPRGSERPLLAQDSQGRAMLARVVPAEVVSDPRAALAWLRGLAAAAGPQHAVALLETASAEDLRRWYQLVHLAGLA